MESGDDERCLRRQAERRLHDDVFATGQAETACPLNLLVGPEAVDFRLDLLQFSNRGSLYHVYADEFTDRLNVI